MPSAVAFHLARTQSRFRSLFYAFILSPLLVGVVIRCYGWIIILANQDGLINSTLRKYAFIDTYIPLMYNYLGVSIGLVHIFLPFMILPLVGVIQSIDPNHLGINWDVGNSISCLDTVDSFYQNTKL